MSALDSLPVIGAVGAACGAVGTAAGAWFKGRAQAKTAAVTAHARETIAVEETERAELALVPALMAEIRLLRSEQRADRDDAVRERERCRSENESLRRELDTVLDAQRASRAERAELCAKVDRMSAELARWHGAVPAGSD